MSVFPPVKEGLAAAQIGPTSRMEGNQSTEARHERTTAALSKSAAVYAVQTHRRAW